ncbi:hypothetical protein LTR91_011379 [Friedmanniomyces endolithicus]|uniref:Uncharacterized protein n=1 Tax=Friedmanniomyces endolithicus TaxID=329885 RepID=A0AAN6KH54_9PEZI|nr:hypothetical protein LTR57_009902 [Friedmanniomyces endolithicus]KAK0978861.1 hypothetical protein LTS01_012637 [Friedmanniomyces endolithicus]KAK0982836.1 hypothetical protein LTR91_011379 [Friedmanniomyces endolithicus]KAK1036776.1 hypothetical protein LTS16_013500 [Friedmanniomyces endolithicus]
MAAIFASPDMAALVAAFVPPSPTKERSSLVRSSSGDHLVDSRKVLEQLRTILETSPSRVRLSDLPLRLGINAKIDWLLAGYDGSAYYSRAGQSLLSYREVDRILEDLLDRSKYAVIDATSYSTGVDVSNVTLRDLLSQDRYGSIHWWQDTEDPAKQYLYHEDLASAVDQCIRSFAPAQWAEGADLSQSFPSAPPGLLLGLARQVNSDAFPAGKWEVLKGRTVFVAEQDGADLESNLAEARKAESRRCATELRNHGFTRVVKTASPPDGANTQDLHAMIEQVKDLFLTYPTKEDHTADLVEISLVDAEVGSACVLTLQASLDEALLSLNLIAPQEAARIWHAREGNEGAPEFRALTLRSLEDELTTALPKLLLQSSHLSTVESSIDSKIEQLQAQDDSRYQSLLTERLLAPLALYAAGLASIRDETLKQHLEEFVGDHFRREVVPSLTAALRGERLILDRSRRKDHEKFQHSIADSKTYSDISSATTKLARKQKLPYPPDTPALQTTKSHTLRSTLKTLRKLPRASDVLQNLVWILLACATEGLYMSAGKDTTRMIRQYQAISQDSDTAMKLGTWRDELKADKSDAEMVREMRRLAEEAVSRADQV